MPARDQSDGEIISAVQRAGFVSSQRRIEVVGRLPGAEFDRWTLAVDGTQFMVIEKRHSQPHVAPTRIRAYAAATSHFVKSNQTRYPSIMPDQSFCYDDLPSGVYLSDILFASIVPTATTGAGWEQIRACYHQLGSFAAAVHATPGSLHHQADVPASNRVTSSIRSFIEFTTANPTKAALRRVLDGHPGTLGVVIEACDADATAKQSAVLHGRLTASSVTVSDGKIVVLGGPDAWIGHPLNDIAATMAQLLEYSIVTCKLQDPEDRGVECAIAFLGGYLRRDPPGTIDWPLLMRYTNLYLINLLLRNPFLTASHVRHMEAVVSVLDTGGPNWFFNVRSHLGK